MAGTNLIRNHHLLSRNLRLNGNYISNDGGDEGIRISDAGLVGIGQATPTALLEIEQGSSGGVTALKIDNNDTDEIAIDVEASNIDANVIAIGANALTTAHVIDIRATGLTNGKLMSGASTCVPTDGGSSTMLSFGITNGGTGDQTAIGMLLDYNKTSAATADGKTANVTGLSIDMDDSATNVGTVNMTGLDINLDYANAAGTVKNTGLNVSVQDADTNYAIITSGGNVGIGEATPLTPLSVSGAITIKEQSTTPSADGEATYGQIWIKNTDPTELWFTNDGGDDIALTGGSLLATASRVMANDISQGDAAVSIGTDTGNITFKDNSEAEWLTFVTSSDDSEILGKSNQKLRLRSVGTQVPLQLISGSSVELSHFTTGPPSTTGSILALKSPQHFTNATCTWSDDSVNITHDATTGGVEEDPSDSALNSQIHVELNVEAETAGIPGDGVEDGYTEVASVASATGFAINKNTTAAATDETVNFIFPYNKTILSRYSGTITAEWQVQATMRAVEQVADQTAGGIPAQLRGSTSGLKAIFSYRTNSVGQPMISLIPSSGGSGYATSFDDSTCVTEDGETSVTHADDSGAIKPYMAVYGTGIPVGAYVATINVENTEFTLSVAATAGNNISTVKLTFYDRVCIQDPGSTSNYAVVEVYDAKDGMIMLGTHTTAQASAGNMIPQLAFDFNESKDILRTSDFRHIGDSYAIDMDWVFIGGSNHIKKSGYTNTFVHAGDRVFFGNTLCNTVNMAIDSSTTTKRIWLAASGLTNGTGRLLNTLDWRNAGGLEIATTTTTGATEVATRVKAGTTAHVAHLTFAVEGRVEFDGCGVGFDRIDGAFDATLSTVDFRTGNKAHLNCTGTAIATLKLTFPDVSGNFVLLIKHPSSGCNITNYLAFDQDGNAADGDPDVKWPGGNKPTLSNDINHVDILSFFWDADTETAYAVASLDFQN